MKNKISIVSVLVFVFILVFISFNSVKADENKDNESENKNQVQSSVQVEVSNKNNDSEIDSEDEQNNDSEIDSEDEQNDDGEIENKSDKEDSEDLNNNDSEDQKDNENLNKEENNHGQKVSKERRSTVANAVQEILNVAERDDSIGDQIRIIALDQNLNTKALEESLGEVDDRNGFVMFFIGPKYTKINQAKKLVEKNKEQVKKLNEIKTEISNKDDAQKLTEQVAVLEQANKQVEDLITESENNFSLFGWLSKIFAKK